MICGHSTSTSLLFFKPKKANIKDFYHVTYELFFEHAIFLCFLSMVFLHFLGFAYFVFKSSSLFHILANIFFPLHHSWSLHMYFNLSYFHFQKTKPFSISQKNTTLWWETKKTNKMYNPCMINQNTKTCTL